MKKTIFKTTLIIVAILYWWLITFLMGNTYDYYLFGKSFDFWIGFWNTLNVFSIGYLLNRNI